jgi:hypothetical protein
MNTEMQKRALAAREAHLALLDLKKVVDEAARTTHAAGSFSACLFVTDNSSMTVA